MRALMTRAAIIAVLSVFSALTGASAELAQNVVQVEKVPIGENVIGYLGISGLSFKGTYAPYAADGSGIYRFRSEPVVISLDEDGPAVALLKEGDFIVSVNDHLITTKKGGRLYSNPPIGRPATLTIRRDGREMDLTIVPAAIEREEPRSLHRVPDLPEIAVLPSLPDLPDLPEISVPTFALPEPLNLMALHRFSPSGWLGFGLSCEKCTIQWNKDEDRSEWSFETPPEVYSVDPDSPADRAGMRRGDVLTHIDNIPLDSEEGSRRFSTVEPGDEVTWTYERDGGKYQAAFTVASGLRWSLYEDDLPQPGKAPTYSDVPVKTPHLRYAGNLGSTKIEVRGVDPVVVSVKEEDGEVIITTSGTTIRLWKED
jgi:hypothetical protein